MIVRRYQNAADFLQKTQLALEEDEAANNLMLGICLQLRDSPDQERPAPYFATVEDEGALAAAAVMTPPHKLVVFGARNDLGEAATMIIRDLWLRQWDVPGVLGPSEIAGPFAQAWIDVSGEKSEFVMRQRVYKLTRVVKEDRARGSLRAATERDVELVARWMCGFEDEIFSTGDLEQARINAKDSIGGGTLFIWEDVKPVSMAAKVRPLSRGVCVSLVFTPPEYRRRGYATACVAALSQRLLDQGWEFCTLFADLSNPASNRVYEKIGYEPTCDFDEYAFQPALSL